MPQLATADDLGLRLGRTFTDDEATRADALLASALGLIQDETRQTIVLVEDDELTIPGTTDDRIALPQKPVVSVTSVTLAGQPLTEGHDWFLKGNEIIRISSLYTRGIGMLDGPFLLGGPGVGFGFPNQQLVITYTHGYADDEIPQTVHSICIEAAVRCIVNPGAVARESVGNTATVYDNNRFAPTGLLLNDDERRKLRRFFGVRARSVSVGG